MVRQFILSIAILLLNCINYSFAQSSPIRFVDGSGKPLAQAQIIEQSGGLYLPVQTLREAFDPGMKQQYSSLTKRLTLNLKEKQLRLRIGSLSVSVNSDEMKLSLSHPPLIIEGQLMLPLTFFTDLLPEIYDFRVTHNPVIQTIHITEKAAPPPDFPPTQLQKVLQNFWLSSIPDTAVQIPVIREVQCEQRKILFLILPKRSRRLLVRIRWRFY